VISVVRVCLRCGSGISADATREVELAYLLKAGLNLLGDASVAGVVDPDGGDSPPVLDVKETARSAKIAPYA
jgi:hypothetical protein